MYHIWQWIISYVSNDNSLSLIYHVWHSTIYCLKQMAMNLSLLYHIWRFIVSYVSIDNDLCLMYHIISDDSLWGMCQMTTHCLSCVSCLIFDNSLYQTIDNELCLSSLTCVSWLIHMCTMTHSYVCHEFSVWCITSYRQFIVSNNWQWIVSYVSYLTMHGLLCVNWQLIVSHISCLMFDNSLCQTNGYELSLMCHIWRFIVSYVSIDNKLSLMYHIISDDSLSRMFQLTMHCLSCVTSTHCLSCVTSMNCLPCITWMHCLVCVNRQWFVSDASHHIWWFIVSYVSNDNTLSLIHHVWHVDRKKPPPPGGFPIYYVPSSRPWVRGPPSKNLYQVLRGGSSYSRFLMREHIK